MKINHKIIIGTILQELSYRVPTGIVDLSNRDQLSILSEILTEWNLDDIKHELFSNLNEAGEEDKHFKNPILNKVIDYEDNNGEKKSGMIGNLLRLDKEQPGRKAAERALPNDPIEREKIMQDLGGENAPKGDTTTGDDQGGEEMAQPVATAFQGKSGDEYRDQLPETDPASPDKPKDIRASSNVPDYQIDYYEKVAEESAPRIQGSSSRGERTKALQNLYAKLQLISMGSKIDLDDNDIANLSKLVISGNARSGKIYDSSLGINKAEGIHSVNEKSPNYANRNLDKNELLNNWKRVSEYMDSKNIPRAARPKFKVGANTLIDNPPKIGHNPVSMKPNRLMEKVKKTPANELIPQKTIADLKEKQGIEVGNDELFGEPLDRNNPKTFLNNIGLVVESTQNYIDSANSPDTKAYFDKFYDGMNRIMNDSKLSDDEKLQTINQELPKLFTDLYNNALEVSDDEAKNVLKDFGELVVYMDFLSKKEEVYLPVSGNYPLADVIVVRRDGNGDALTIDSVSIKSQKGKEEQPGSSAMEFCKHFANVYPNHKKTFDSLGALHTNSIEAVKLDDILDEGIKKDIKSIQNLDNMKSWDDAKKVCNELNLDWDKVKRALERTQYPKYKNEIEFTPESMRSITKELIYRQYAFDKTLSTFNDLKLDTKLKFVEVVVEPEEIAVRAKGKDSTTADFAAHDKGYLGKGGILKQPPPPHVGPVKYQSANMALRYKPKKSKM